VTNQLIPKGLSGKSTLRVFNMPSHTRTLWNWSINMMYKPIMCSNWTLI